MGAQFSKKIGSSSRHNSPPESVSHPQPVTPDLSSYEAACKSDPQLQSFDYSLQQRTSRVINTLAVGVEVRSLSLDSLQVLTESLLEMNHEVVKVILECRKDIWKSRELFSLVEDYFENSLRTLDFCTALEKSLKRARDSQLIIQVAVQQFDEDRKLGTQNYLKTLQQFKRFKSAGDPFSDEFFVLFQNVYMHQAEMFKKLQIKKSKLDKKLKSRKTWRRVSNAIFVATFASVLICSVVAASIAAPPVVTALAAAAAVPLGSMGKWFNSMWKKYENELKGQIEMIDSMQVGTYIVIKDLDNIRILVERLEIDMEGLLQNVDFAITEEDECVVLAVDEIKKKLNGFAKTIEDLSEHADKCSRDIRRARTVILQRIMKSPSNSL